MVSSINGNMNIEQYYNKGSNKVAGKQTSWIKNWVQDKDKICTDGLDDGKISAKEASISFGKGLIGVVKSAIKHPIVTGLTIAAGAALTVATGGAALPVMVAAGATLGVGQIGYGAYKAVTAKSDGEAKQAFETMGNGTFAVAASTVSAKGALNAASKAGVTSAQGAEKLNILQATRQCIKSTPEAITQSGLNIKGNFLTATTGTVHANSNTLRKGQVQYMSKANEAQAYRFNPNGTPEEIVQNNPGVFIGKDGGYYVQNKWNPDAPFAIDPSKEQMIMMYGPDDMAVCDGQIFKGSYVDSSAYKAGGQLNYQDPTSLDYGKIINVTKQAPGAFTIAPEGTQVQTLEGAATVGKGQVIAVDHAGNPYVTTAANVLKRNIVPEEGAALLKELIPES